MRLKGIYLASGAAAAMALSAGAASADPLGWYGAIDAGWHKAEASGFELGGTSTENEFELKEDWAA
ncbi:MAG TPA: cell envelope biogenesis protein OmpA, partial [Brevundimonas sp.]|nr:cell envelope biogenesis protein OmpA [Brevundimonas sp.]